MKDPKTVSILMPLPMREGIERARKFLAWKDPNPSASRVVRRAVFELLHRNDLLGDYRAEEWTDNSPGGRPRRTGKSGAKEKNS